MTRTTESQWPAKLSAQIVVSGGRGRAQGIFAAWEDGFVAWSADTIAGGAPYFCGWREPADVRAIVAGVLQRTIDEAWPLREMYVGPSSRYSALTVYRGGEPSLYMATWHELFEANPNLVVTAGGVEPLAGRTRADVLAAQPAAYLAFRRRWQAVKEQLLALLPPDGRRYDPGSQRPLPWQ